ncbi:hypothetical protein [Xenorhabdus sp. KK7.4]|uniref:hypothetical protein n=1 Tax=Xenorhabdus sp. KK7.4 TaxID=1851572 RepID=UPI000C05314D|nr:hypothetical protein [Xenorhabdus sp. KK7.4]PHM50975.1 hypothetical protein Xekk_04137 [Xenorhabdus sp. KK7.4]
MLTVLFYVLLGLATVHYIYERILLPSVRLYYRNQLFSLRDSIRNEIISDKSKLDTTAANLIHEALNNAINRLHLLTLPNRVRARKRLAANPEIEARIRKEIELFKKCNNHQVIDTIRKSADILQKVLLFNSLMMIMYLSPFFLFFAISSLMVRAAKNLMKQLKDDTYLEEAVMLLPDRQVSKVVFTETQSLTA